MTDGWKFKKVEIEIALLPGLPAVHITGLPDALVKESVARLKSAFRAQNFEWPRTKQIFINLQPSHLKKTGAGLELGIAAAILHATDQITIDPNGVYYASVGLDGQINPLLEAQRLRSLDFPEVLYTGPIESHLLVDAKICSNLNELDNPVVKPAQKIRQLLTRPAHPAILLSERAARLLSILALGEHSCLLLGPAGSGKSTFAECLTYISNPPTDEAFAEALAMSQWMGYELQWRPFVAPHHSTPAKSMIGCGRPIHPGEISRAHGGILLLDEYLEFKSDVQEALREPTERGRIRISRFGDAVDLPAQFQLLATSNLCICGDLVPGRIKNCNYSLTRCRSHLERFSGPMLDRFDTLEYTHLWKGSKCVPLAEILEKVSRGYEHQLKRGQKLANARLNVADLEPFVDPFTFQHLIPGKNESMRRQRALLRVARSIADLEMSEKIELPHIEEAQQLTLLHVRQLKEIFS